MDSAGAVEVGASGFAATVASDEDSAGAVEIGASGSAGTIRSDELLAGPRAFQGIATSRDE